MAIYEAFVRKVEESLGKSSDWEANSAARREELVSDVSRLAGWPRDQIKLAAGNEHQGIKLRLGFRLSDGSERSISLPVRFSGDRWYVELQNGPPAPISDSALRAAIEEQSGYRFV